MLRRALITVVVVAGFVGGVLAGRQTQPTGATRFATVPYVSRAYASHRTPISTTWYCGGVPAADETVSGELIVANPTDVALNGRITYVNAEGDPPVVQTLVAPPRDKLSIDVKAAMSGTYVSAIVEIQGGEGMVEQRALFPAGDAVSSCVTQTSPTWYFADGWTADGSTEQLVITNPYASSVRIDIAFFDKNGVKRTPGAFQGDSIDPLSVRVIDVGSSGFADEEVIGVEVVSDRGRMIVARAQHYRGGGRVGYSLNLGVPTPTEQLWFVDGDHGEGITEQYVLFNPTDQDAEATATVLGIPPSDAFVAPETIPVPAGEVVRFDTADIEGLPDGPHGMVFSTADRKNSLVVERVITRVVDGAASTSVVASMTPEFAFATRWYLPVSVDEADDQAIVVLNPFASEATITLKSVGPGGEVAVPGMENIALAGAGLITIPLTEPSIFGRIVVVESTAGVFVERRLPRGHDLVGLSGSWALPECGPCKLSSPSSS